jgi:hypothetical protein
MGSSFLVDREFEEMTIEKATDRQRAAPWMAHMGSRRLKPIIASDVPTRHHRSFERRAA